MPLNKETETFLACLFTLHDWEIEITFIGRYNNNILGSESSKDKVWDP